MVAPTEIARRLAAALDHDALSVLYQPILSLRLAYQPIVSLRDGSLHELEALCRWTDPEHGIVPPAVFIPVAEQAGLIDRLGAWVLGEAVRTVGALNRQRAGQPPLRLAVNLSSRQLEDPAVADHVGETLAASGFNPALLTFEITESCLLAHHHHHRLHDLADLGLRLSIDDFGTGYSSFSYLAGVPADTVKIDRSFVVAAADNDRRATLLNGVIGLLHSLGMATVAEGIETAEQLAVLRDMECDLGQGFLLSEPIEALELADRLAAVARKSTGRLAAPAAAPAGPRQALRAVRLPTVLIVDDDPVALQLCRYLLSAHGRFRVLTAANGDEFGDVLARERPDLILMDVHLPGRSGTELVGDLQADPQTARIPVAAITAFPERLTDWRAAGFSGLLPKPWEPERFADNVGELMAPALRDRYAS